jgi:hypothetical protein
VGAALRPRAVFFCFLAIPILLPTSKTFVSCRQFGWVSSDPHLDARLRHLVSPEWQFTEDLVVCPSPAQEATHKHEECARKGGSQMLLIDGGRSTTTLGSTPNLFPSPPFTSPWAIQVGSSTFSRTSLRLPQSLEWFRTWFVPQIPHQ